MSRFRLERARAAVLVVDVQERLCAAMPPAELERVVNRTQALLAGARVLRLPTVVTEQYPRGLGPTLTSIREEVGEVTRVEKVRFSAAIEPVLGAWGDRDQILIAGLETHVCVYQTARDLVAVGKAPWVCADAVLSRTSVDRQVGLELCRAAGAAVTTVEAALFDLLQEAGSAEFKAISAAVK
ncbi:MAG TPA: isochorismatase family protein [Myxococcaceae bacterium]|nr:isochorismatase family protein [Myxococcaceae bacterium]